MRTAVRHSDIGGFKAAVGDLAPVQIAHGGKELEAHPCELKLRKLGRAVVVNEVTATAVLEDRDHVTFDVKVRKNIIKQTINE